jgi:hypothetical protein
VSAAQNNIYIEQGDEWSRTMTIKVNDVAQDIGLWGLSGGVQSRLGDGKVEAFSWTKLEGGTTGQVVVKLTAEQTARLQGEKLFYDWHYTVNGIKKRLVEGIVTLSREVR